MKSRLKVLYVEDDKDDFQTISLILSRSKHIDFDIDWVKTPEEFYDKCKIGNYDAFIVDYRLGSVTGLDLIREANISMDKPIILLTAYGSEDLDKEALEAGASFFVDKDNLADDWQMLDKALRYSSVHSKRIYNSLRSGVRLQSTDEIDKIKKIFDFDYIKISDVN